MAFGRLLDVFHWFLFLVVQFQSLSVIIVVFGILVIVGGCYGSRRGLVRATNGFW